MDRIDRSGMNWTKQSWSGLNGPKFDRMYHILVHSVYFGSIQSNSVRFYLFGLFGSNLVLFSPFGPFGPIHPFGLVKSIWSFWSTLVFWSSTVCLIHFGPFNPFSPLLSVLSTKILVEWKGNIQTYRYDKHNISKCIEQSFWIYWTNFRCRYKRNYWNN